MKKIAALFLVTLLSLSLAQPAMADCKGGQCPLKKKCSGSHERGEKYGCPVVTKIMKKAHFLLDKQQELGLSEEQVKNIKAIKMETKKAHIRQQAEMKIFHLDLKQKLSESEVDAEGLNAMMDSAAEGFATNGKASVASYIKLKAVLTPEQLAKAKEFWMQKKSGYSHH